MGSVMVKSIAPPRERRGSNVSRQIHELAADPNISQLASTVLGGMVYAVVHN